MVSIIVPCYNVEEYIDECIGSLVGQDFKDIEIVAVDDGSKDQTGAKLDVWEQQDSRVKVFHTENRGRSAARNLGIEKSAGEYIGFVDSDDAVKPDYVSTLYNALVENGADYSQVSQYCNIVGTDEYKYIPAVREITVYDSFEQYAEDVYLDKDKKMFVSGIVACLKLYKRELFDTVRFPEGRLMEDCWIFPEIAIQCKKIVVCPDCLYFYRQREGSTTKVISSAVVEQKMEAWIHNRDWWKDSNISGRERLMAATEKYLCHYMYTSAKYVSNERRPYFKKVYCVMVRHIIFTKYLSVKTKAKYLSFASPMMVWKNKNVEK